MDPWIIVHKSTSEVAKHNVSDFIIPSAFIDWYSLKYIYI